METNNNRISPKDYSEFYFLKINWCKLYKDISQNIGYILITTTFLIVLVLSLIPLFEYEEINEKLIIGIVGLMATFYFGEIKSKIENDRVFKDLFDSFNSKYNGDMNDLINELRNSKSRRKLTPKEKNLVIDYFNLCAEEYLWKKKKRITDDVWEAWKAGIEDNLVIPQIGALFLEEIKDEKRRISYYGLDTKININEVFITSWIIESQKNESMKNANCLFRLVNHDTIDTCILSNIIYHLEDKLDESIKSIIKENNIHLLLAVSPGCVTKVILDSDAPLKKLIVIDKTLTYGFLKFNVHEVAAEVLHEVGHILNKEPLDKMNEKEFYADDFVRRCGFSCQLLSGLRKYKDVIESYTEKTKKSFFETTEKQNQIIELFKKRIERIENGDTLLIGVIDN